MKKITEIIIHPNFDESPEMPLDEMVNLIKRNLGIFNILKINLNMPVILFNGHLSDDVVEKVAKFITGYGYCSTIITLTDDVFKLNGKQIEYED